MNYNNLTAYIKGATHLLFAASVVAITFSVSLSFGLALAALALSSASNAMTKADDRN